ncbi:MAG: hypothetical protein NVS3B12_26950 [Acidimicrobiales bacterium]
MRVVAFLVPVGLSLLVARLAAGLLPHARTTPARVAWWATVLLASTITVIAADRLARRALPLAALLRLSMAFPDQVPNRFSVALRAATLSKLETRVALAPDHGDVDDSTESAARVLELVGALSRHDPRTRGHSERVRAFNDLLAEEMGLSEADRDKLRWAALLHDVGKLGVSHQILNKVGKPDEREWAMLKAHPEMGARIAAPLRGWLGVWSEAIIEHHERWDGQGYPLGLAGQQISLGGRIVAVADSFEVMTAPRPYKRPVSAAVARRELAACAGAQFDPEVVRAFLNISIPELRQKMGLLSWLAQLPIIGGVPRLEGVAISYSRTAALAAGTTTAAGAIVISGMVNPSPSAAHTSDTGPTAVVAPGSVPAQGSGVGGATVTPASPTPPTPSGQPSFAPSAPSFAPSAPDAQVVASTRTAPEAPTDNTPHNSRPQQSDPVQSSSPGPSQAPPKSAPSPRHDQAPSPTTTQSDDSETKTTPQKTKSGASADPSHVTDVVPSHATDVVPAPPKVNGATGPHDVGASIGKPKNGG